MLVSSGAVAAGMGRLGWKRRPTDLAELQAAAAVGQSRLIESYNKALAPHGLNAAQMLLTAEDLQHRTRYLNVRNTLLRAVPLRRHCRSSTRTTRSRSTSCRSASATTIGWRRW